MDAPAREPAGFAAATAVVPTGDDAAGGCSSFTGEVSPTWTIVGRPNGGYLLAMIGRAVVAGQDHPHVLAASAHYLRSPDPGPVRIEVEALRRGRSASQFRARMRQGQVTVVETLFTTGELAPGTAPAWDAGAPRPDLPPAAELVRVPGRTPTGTPAAIMDRVDLRLDPRHGGTVSAPSGQGVITGLLALGGGEDFDPLALLYAADALPPATFDIGVSGWVPTLELTVYVRALPAPGPVTVRQVAQLVEADRVDEQCWVWDARGRLVAHATQLAGIRFTPAAMPVASPPVAGP